METMKTVEQLARGLSMENACILCIAGAGLACINLNGHRLMIKGDNISRIDKPVQQCAGYAQQAKK